MKGQDEPRTPCHSGRDAAATELCKGFFFFFSFSLFFFFLSFSPPPFFSFSSFSFFLFFFFFFFKVGKETPRRQEADLQDFRVLLKGLRFFFYFPLQTLAIDITTDSRVENKLPPPKWTPGVIWGNCVGFFPTDPRLFLFLVCFFLKFLLCWN